MIDEESGEEKNKNGLK